VASVILRVLDVSNVIQRHFLFLVLVAQDLALDLLAAVSTHYELCDVLANLSDGLLLVLFDLSEAARSVDGVTERFKLHNGFLMKIKVSHIRTCRIDVVFILFFILASVEFLKLIARFPLIIVLVLSLLSSINWCILRERERMF